MRVTLTIVPDPTDPTGLQGVVSTIRCAADAGFKKTHR
jgi:hypothetical protein